MLPTSRYLKRRDPTRLPFLEPSKELANAARYYAVALPAIVRPHKLEPSKSVSSYRSHFAVSRAEQRRWFDLFGVEHELGERLPFTYATTSATLTFMRLLSNLGINLKYVRHVLSDITVNPANLAVKPDHVYSYEVSLSDIFELSNHRVVLELGSGIFDAAGTPCARHEDYFLVTNVNADQLVIPQAPKHLAKRVRFEKVSAYKKQLQGEARRFNVHPHMGRLYGRLSGDRNIVHTTYLAAHLMGFPKPFVQGFCTVNLVLSLLATQTKRDLKRLHCTFARPIFVGEDIDLFCDRERFELCNQAGKVLAYGKAQFR